MFESFMTTAVSLAAISAGLMAGVYFAFSTFIMRSFDQLGALQATAAMNAINEVILRSWFMALFFGSTLLFAILSAIALYSSDLSGRWWLFSSGLIYVVGMFVCTAAFNVPLNNRLARVKNDSDDSLKAATWSLYFIQWTRWNHLRSVCSLAAMILSIIYLSSIT